MKVKEVCYKWPPNLVGDHNGAALAYMGDTIVAAVHVSGISQNVILRLRDNNGQIYRAQLNAPDTYCNSIALICTLTRLTVGDLGDVDIA